MDDSDPCGQIDLTTPGDEARLTAQTDAAFCKPAWEILEMAAAPRAGAFEYHQQPSAILYNAGRAEFADHQLTVRNDSPTVNAVRMLIGFTAVFCLGSIVRIMEPIIRFVFVIASPNAKGSQISHLGLALVQEDERKIPLK